jgi:amidophosphoribosyltransferase
MESNPRFDEKSKFANLGRIMIVCDRGERDFMAELHHECGIAGLYLLPDADLPAWVPHDVGTNVSRLIPRMLLDLQNRGQLAAGITGYNPSRAHLLSTYRELGSVYEAFKFSHRDIHQGIMNDVAGPAGIGHVRYATCGTDDKSAAQPFERVHGCKWKWFAFAFNGQLANFPDLARDLLEKEGYHLVRETDTEVIMHHLSYQLRADRPDLVDMFTALARKFDGAYNLLYINAMGEMVAVRDPLGIRPLCWARDGGLVGFASESVALFNLGFRDIKSIEPGQIITVTSQGIQTGRIAPKIDSAHCFFEWIYFANVASELDGKSVYQVRAALGRELARTEVLQPDDNTIVVPVPDTAKAAADAMAFELKVPSMEGLFRNRYVGRTFIQGADRTERARQKYTPVHQVLQGKRVILVEDTIVRSTTMQSLIRLMRDTGGAKEIHVRVACPPIVAPCFYGIDMSSVGELFAPKHMTDIRNLDDASLGRMADAIGADSLRYLSAESLATAIGLSERQLCRACVNGDYPTAEGRRLYQIELSGKSKDQTGRIYERIAAAR